MTVTSDVRAAAELLSMTACVSCVTCACVLLFFCLRNFLAFIAFLVHFLFCLRIFSYARPCVRCVRLNGNRASVSNTDAVAAHNVFVIPSTSMIGGGIIK